MVRCNTVVTAGIGAHPGSQQRVTGFGYCEPPGGSVTAFLGCAQAWRDPPPEEQGGSVPRACRKFGVSKLSHAPKTKRLQHGQGELRVQIETKEINRVISCFSEGSLKSGGHIFSPLGLENGVQPFSCLPPTRAESLQGAKQRHLVDSGAT